MYCARWRHKRLMNKFRSQQCLRGQSSRWIYSNSFVILVFFLCFNFDSFTCALQNDKKPNPSFKSLTIVPRNDSREVKCMIRPYIAQLANHDANFIRTRNTSISEGTYAFYMTILPNSLLSVELTANTDNSSEWSAKIFHRSDINHIESAATSTYPIAARHDTSDSDSGLRFISDTNKFFIDSLFHQDGRAKRENNPGATNMFNLKYICNRPLPWKALASFEIISADYETMAIGIYNNIYCIISKLGSAPILTFDGSSGGYITELAPDGYKQHMLDANSALAIHLPKNYSQKNCTEKSCISILWSLAGGKFLNVPYEIVLDNKANGKKRVSLKPKTSTGHLKPWNKVWIADYATVLKTTNTSCSDPATSGQTNGPIQAIDHFLQSQTLVSLTETNAIKLPISNLNKSSDVISPYFPKQLLQTLSATSMNSTDKSTNDSQIRITAMTSIRSETGTVNGSIMHVFYARYDEGNIKEYYKKISLNSNSEETKLSKESGPLVSPDDLVTWKKCKKVVALMGPMSAVFDQHEDLVTPNDAIYSNQRSNFALASLQDSSNGLVNYDRDLVIAFQGEITAALIVEDHLLAFTRFNSLYRFKIDQSCNRFRVLKEDNPKVFKSNVFMYQEPKNMPDILYDEASVLVTDNNQSNPFWSPPLLQRSSIEKGPDLPVDIPLIIQNPEVSDETDTPSTGYKSDESSIPLWAIIIVGLIILMIIAISTVCCICQSRTKKIPKDISVTAKTYTIVPEVPQAPTIATIQEKKLTSSRDKAPQKSKKVATKGKVNFGKNSVFNLQGSSEVESVRSGLFSEKKTNGKASAAIKPVSQVKQSRLNSVGKETIKDKFKFYSNLSVIGPTKKGSDLSFVSTKSAMTNLDSDNNIKTDLNSVLSGNIPPVKIIKR